MPQSRLVKIVGVILIAGVMAGCASTPTNTVVQPTHPATVPTGNLITIVHDVPFCSALSAVVVIQNLNFNQTQSNVFAPYLNTTAAFAPEIRLNLQQLRDFDTILYSFPSRGERLTWRTWISSWGR